MAQVRGAMARPACACRLGPCRRRQRGQGAVNKVPVDAVLAARQGSCAVFGRAGLVCVESSGPCTAAAPCRVEAHHEAPCRVEAAYG